MRQPPVCEDAGYARLREELPPDQHAADLRGAGADLVELGVAQQPARREVVDVAVAAQRLDRGLIRQVATPTYPSNWMVAGWC